MKIAKMVALFFVVSAIGRSVNARENRLTNAVFDLNVRQVQHLLNDGALQELSSLEIAAMIVNLRKKCDGKSPNALNSVVKLITASTFLVLSGKIVLKSFDDDYSKTHPWTWESIRTLGEMFFKGHIGLALNQGGAPNIYPLPLIAISGSIATLSAQYAKNALNELWNHEEREKAYAILKLLENAVRRHI